MDAARETTIPHSNDCCGCLSVVIQGETAEITCNECGAVVRSVPVGELDQTLTELARTEAVCSATCPHCGALNVFPGWSAIEAYVCRECGEGVSMSPSSM